MPQVTFPTAHMRDQAHVLNGRSYRGHDWPRLPGCEQMLASGSIMGLAILLRCVAVWVWSAELAADPDGYRGLAQRLAAGRGFVGADGAATAFRPPLFPALLAGAEWFGQPESRWLLATLHVAFGAATVVLTAVAGRRIGLGRWSLVAAGAVAVDPLLLRYTPQVMTEVTCALLSAALLWAAAARGRDTFRPALLAGLLFGLAVLARPTYWVFGGLAAGVWVLEHCSSRGHARASLRRIRPVRSVGPLVLGVVLVVTPWLVRNAVVIGRPLLTTTHGGYTLLLGNNPVFYKEVVAEHAATVWQGESLAAWQAKLEVDMAADGVLPGDELARDAWARRRAIGNIRAQPRLFLQACGLRLRRLWGLRPLGPAAESAPAGVRWAVGVYYAGLFLLAGFGGCGWAAGGWRSRRRWRSRKRWRTSKRWRARLLPAVLLIAGFTAVHTVYWTDARMRAPLTPAIALLAAAGLRYATRIRRRTTGVHRKGGPSAFGG